MPKSLSKSSKHLIAEWPEVFEDLYINTLPLEYIDLIKLEFVNGRLWEFNLKDHIIENSESLEKLVVDSFRDFENEISKLEIKINIIKLKSDIINQSKNIF
jgi:hypothetical protein